ncbi:MAG: hypothetical protein ACSHW7_12135 [Patiriisocius sp.]|uniref:hypothetical protein n=1 Tax=Patiriisocius sp. TaxID=2822396 RepID=UPI003EFAB53B
MKKIDQLIKLIINTERELILSKQKYITDKIDINKDGWMEKVQIENQNFLNYNKYILAKASNTLINDFDNLNKGERDLLWNAFSNSDLFNTYFGIYEDDIKVESFKDNFIKLIIQDLGNDTRDALLEIEELIEYAKENNIDYVSTIKEVIPYSNSVDKHGMGSMKSILEKIIS